MSEAARTKYQTGEVARLSRDQIKLASYNPRRSTPEARRRMKENLRKVGLVGPSLIWNRRTGNLVQGHLRLAQLDVLEARTDYLVDCTVVEWTEAREKQQNVFFNNSWAQGQFDLEALGSLLADDLEHLDAFGMDPVEVQHLFPGDERFGALFEDLEPEKTTMPEAKAALDEIEQDRATDKSQNAELKKLEAAEATKQQRKDIGKVLDEANSADFYVVIVCKDGGQATRVLGALGTRHTGSRYVSAELVLRALGKAEAGDAAPPEDEAPVSEPAPVAEQV
jgi:ParB-like chromosome segregation protein Spo0J